MREQSQVHLTLESDQSRHFTSCRHKYQRFMVELKHSTQQITWTTNDTVLQLNGAVFWCYVFAGRRLLTKETKSAVSGMLCHAFDEKCLGIKVQRSASNNPQHVVSSVTHFHLVPQHHEQLLFQRGFSHAITCQRSEEKQRKPILHETQITRLATDVFVATAFTKNWSVWYFNPSNDKQCHTWCEVAVNVSNSVSVCNSANGRVAVAKASDASIRVGLLQVHRGGFAAEKSKHC